jgi:hypothetical protein
MAASASRKMNAAFLFVVFLVGILSAFAPAFFASREVRRFCEDLPLGAPVAEVQRQVVAKEYSLGKLDDGSFAIEHRTSLGRVECTLRFDEQGKLASKSRPP